MRRKLYNQYNKPKAPIMKLPPSINTLKYLDNKITRWAKYPKAILVSFHLSSGTDLVAIIQ